MTASVRRQFGVSAGIGGSVEATQRAQEKDEVWTARSTRKNKLVSAALVTLDKPIRTLIKDVLQRRLKRVALGLCADVRGRHWRGGDEVERRGRAMGGGSGVSSRKESCLEQRKSRQQDQLRRVGSERSRTPHFARFLFHEYKLVLMVKLTRGHVLPRSMVRALENDVVLQLQRQEDREYKTASGGCVARRRTP